MPYTHHSYQPVRTHADSESTHGSVSSPLQAKMDSSVRQLIQQKRVTSLQGILQRKNPLTQSIQARLSGVNQGAVGLGRQQAVQRKVFKQGGKKAAEIPASAKNVARWVMKKASIQPGGSNYIADVHNRGFSGFKMWKNDYVGGRTFNNGAQPDNNKLPYAAGQTYQEWDINPSLAGQGRGAERIVTSSDGKVYYTGDHYANFTEFTS